MQENQCNLWPSFTRHPFIYFHILLKYLRSGKSQILDWNKEDSKIYIQYSQLPYDLTINPAHTYADAATDTDTEADADENQD